MSITRSRGHDSRHVAMQLYIIIYWVPNRLIHVDVGEYSSPILIVFLKLPDPAALFFYQQETF